MVAETLQQPTAAGAIIAVGQVRSSTSSLPKADLESVKQIITQTKAIGVILPPPDIRAIVDKTAQFVAKNGANLQQKQLCASSSAVLLWHFTSMPT
jgi:splicing factor 3A subunit 1